MDDVKLFFEARLRYPGGFELNARFQAGNGVSGIIGPSGSGKSTILSLIAGTLRPDRSLIQLNGTVLVDTAKGIFVPPERRRIGIVFQDQLLFPHLSVRKNLIFGHGRGGGRAIDFHRVVEILQIGELLERFPGSLSGGQRQRVSLGRALLRGPDLLLLDEPFVALERELKERIADYLGQALREWPIPTLLVSHDHADVGRLTENVVRVDRGKIREDQGASA